MYFYEWRIVHPAFERSLKAKGWNYQHEVKLTRSGQRVDFLAYQTPDTVYVIEVKKDCADMGHAIYQALNYAYLVSLRRSFLPDATDIPLKDTEADDIVLIGRRAKVVCPLVVVPHFTVTKEAEKFCKDNGVGLVGIKLRQRK